MTMLEQYGANNQVIRAGSFTGRDVTSDNLPGQVTDNDITNMLIREMNQNTVPLPDANRLYVVLTPPQVTVSGQATPTSSGFLGYHGYFSVSIGQTTSNVYYAVLPFGPGVGLNNPISSLSADAQVMAVASHELAEAVTDPALNAWYDPTIGPQRGEVGDLANQNFGSYDGYTVQRIWSNVDGRGVLPGELANAANGIFSSGEYLGDLVTGFYATILHRTQAPSPAEVNSWVTPIQQNHLTDEAVIADFLTSAEFAQQFGGAVAPGALPTDAQNQLWVTGVYQAVLQHAPSASALSGWMSNLASTTHGGNSRNGVAYTIVRSTEAETIMVDSYYQHYLQRAADPGANQYISDLANGYVTREQVQAGTVASQEFFNLHGGFNEGWVTGLYQTALNRNPDPYGYGVYLNYLRSGG